MKISIIIPIHNGSKTIENCLRAIFNSKYKEYEVIVVDTNSSDNTVEIARKFPVRIIPLEMNPGAGAARNRGIKYADGTIILFIDSDVIIDENVLDLLVEDFKANSAIDAVQVLYSQKCSFKNFTSIYSNLHYYYYGMKNKEGGFTTIGTFCVAIKKDVFVKAGGFDEDPSGRTTVAEDQKFGNKFTHMGFKIHLDKKITVEHRKYYSLVKYLLHDIQTGAQQIKCILRNRNKVISQAVKTGRLGVMIPVSFIAGSGLSFLIFITLPVLVFFRYLWINITLCAMIFLFYLLNFGFLFFCLKTKRWSFFVRACLISYLRVLFGFFGALRGLLDYATNAPDKDLFRE